MHRLISTQKKNFPKPDHLDFTRLVNNLISDAVLDVDTAPIPSKTADVCGSSCPVFLSYQWDLQDTVKRLKSRMEESGIQCWMDIGQMGGGDALFAKIDAGIRACKVR